MNKKYLIFTLLAIIFLGLLHVPYPFCGDQAFFLLGAREMNDGMILYKDFWDIKQPGIFYFYLIAGKLFGFSAQGIHLFELFYWLVFAWLLILFLKRGKYFHSDILNYLAPLFFLGSYYGLCYHRFLTQVEALVAFPLLLTLICNQLYLNSAGKRNIWLLLSGLSGGLVLYFKLIFAPLLLCFWLWLWVQNKKTFPWKRNLMFLPIMAVFLAGGILISWLPFLFYAWQHQILGLCYETFLKFPPLVVQYGQKRPIHDLILAWKGFFDSVKFLWPMALLSLLFLHKRKSLGIPLWLWLLMGIAVILIQVTSWYPYQFQLLYLPMVLLAFITLDYIFEKSGLFCADFLFPNMKMVKGFIIILIASPILFSIGSKVKELKAFHFAIRKNDQIAFATGVKDNMDAWKISQAMPVPKARNPLAFVIDDPLVYYYTGLKQATTQSGWSMQLFIPGQMDTLLEELKARKPELIFFYNRYQPFMKIHGQQVTHWILDNYKPAVVIPEGIWYVSGN